MHDDADLAAWLRFALVPGIGLRRQLVLLQALGSPQNVLAASFGTLSKVLTDPIKVQAFIDFAAAPEPELVAQTRAWLAQPEHSMVCLGDDAYPAQFLELPDAPLFFFCKGRVELLQQPALAIVGSRNATVGAIDNAERFAETLSASGLTVVSGLAAGIDAAAHRGGLRGPGSTIAFVGTGLDRVYPASNRQLAHQIAAAGLIISEFMLGEGPIKDHFPRRNRLIAALARGCLVVEAAMGSGSLITARQANEMGREVFAIPGSIHSPLAKGCHHLIKQGAKLVESAEDIMTELAWDSSAVQTPVTPAATAAQLDATEQKVLQAAGFDPVDADTLGLRVGLTPDRLCAILLALEMKGVLFTLPGNRYQRRA
ncbi:hypothetical protein WG78_21145 [Amantichitinum ursilacus]|uniref:Uncharacterized protein n=1 Tax=Amantichitinum ursilacus TaxID=857265 RepID=A0A0N1JRJ0_9NEIS|nr:hypothetical protein WG78_21145 [Amantichitinum ursilacus]